MPATCLPVSRDKIDDYTPIIKHVAVDLALHLYARTAHQYLTLSEKLDSEGVEIPCTMPEDMPEDADPRLRKFWEVSVLLGIVEEYLTAALDVAAALHAIGTMHHAGSVPRYIIDHLRTPERLKVSSPLKP